MDQVLAFISVASDVRPNTLLSVCAATDPREDAAAAVLFLDTIYLQRLRTVEDRQKVYRIA
mgnify:CR=1 FL=1